MSNNIKKEIEKIQIPKELRMNSLLGIEKAKKDKNIVMNKPKRKIRKVIYLSSAAVAINGAKRGLEQKWSPVIAFITDTLMGKSSFKVTGVGYSGKHNHMNIVINTSVLSSSSEAEEISSRIVKTVRNIILSKESQSVIKDEPYKIIVYSKEEKNLIKNNEHVDRFKE